MEMCEQVGVLGYGQLGVPLVRQITAHGLETYVYDPAGVAFDLGADGVDPHLKQSTNEGLAQVADTAEEVVGAATIIHFAAPSQFADSIPPAREGQMVVLHDSVMANSVAALERRGDDVECFVVAHMIMNRHRKVVLAEGLGDTVRAEKHFRGIGLDPVIMTGGAHDELSAATQGGFMLSMIRRLPSLIESDRQGLLAPSGEEELHALTHRNARWSDATLLSIAENPYLEVEPGEVESFIRWRNALQYVD